MDATTVRTWLAELGLDASPQAGAAGEEVTFGLQGGVDRRGAIRWRTPAVMDVFHTTQVPAAELWTHWRDPSNVATPVTELRDAVQYVAARYPLVTGEASEYQGGAVVYFSSVLFADQLSRQAFALTVSSVLKAAEAFDAGAKSRAEQLAALATLQAR